MSISSLTDPNVAALADAALDRAWQLIVAKGLANFSDAAERARLSAIIADLATVARDVNDLTEASFSKYRQTIAF